MIRNFGRFIIFLIETCSDVEGFTSLWANFIEECIKVGYKSLLIVIVVSTFTGAVSAIQTSYNLTAPYIQDYVVALVVRDTIFSLIPTLIALIYSGKVGSHISGELGTMKITEQVDALEVMGINSKSYLILPKVLASLCMFPMLVILACFMSLYGGFLTIQLLGIVTETDYILGIRTDFNEFVIGIIMIKSLLFSVLIPTISAFHGYNTQGGALEVGKAGTSAVISCCIAVLIGDFILTELLTA